MMILSQKKNSGFTLVNPNSEGKAKGFTLIELLVVISIIAILVGLSIFGLQGARESSRDAKRKADLEQIRSGIEIYRADCSTYPVGSGGVSGVLGSALTGDDSSTSCASTNTYINQVPSDPISPNNYYVYDSSGTTYEICAALEQGNPSTVNCGGISSCGGASCNYKVVNP